VLWQAGDFRDRLQSFDRNAFPLFDGLVANAELTCQPMNSARCFNRSGHYRVLPDDIVPKEKRAFGLWIGQWLCRLGFSAVNVASIAGIVPRGSRGWTAAPNWANAIDISIASGS
jgi:hypothetical protein